MGNLTHGDIVNLCKAGNLNAHLRTTWRRKTGYDPVAVADAVVTENHKRGIFLLFGCGLAVAGVILFHGGFFVEELLNNDAVWMQHKVFYPAPGFLLMVAGCAMVFYHLHLKNLPAGYEFPLEAKQFPDRYQRLLNDAMISRPSSIGTFDKPTLTKLADEILTNKALGIVRLQDRGSEVWDAQKTWERDFDWTHQNLWNFDIASAQVNRYFDKARKLFREEQEKEQAKNAKGLLVETY